MGSCKGLLWDRTPRAQLNLNASYPGATLCAFPPEIVQNPAVK